MSIEIQSSFGSNQQKGLQIPDGSITSQKLADGAVTNQKIADGSITSSKLGAFLLPDYSSMTQVLSATNTDWTATEPCIVYLSWNGYATSGTPKYEVRVNNKVVQKYDNEQTNANGTRVGSYSTTLVLKAGDVLRLYSTSSSLNYVVGNKCPLVWQ